MTDQLPLPLVFGRVEVPVRQPQKADPKQPTIMDWLAQHPIPLSLRPSDD
jgi:hypothetical protein